MRRQGVKRQCDLTQRSDLVPVWPSEDTPAGYLSGTRSMRTLLLEGNRGNAMAVTLTVNGAFVTVSAADNTPLLDVLRNHLDLKGSRYGCGLEQCGSCMVLLDGEPVYACAREVGTVAGRSITTIEGLGSVERPHPLQQAFVEEQAGQCGYCLSGIVISAAALLRRNPVPSRAEIVAALDMHLCRCGAHPRILRAVEKAASRLRETVAGQGDGA
jgi:nicotinate dehydrogenase subunit A